MEVLEQSDDGPAVGTGRPVDDIADTAYTVSQPGRRSPSDSIRRRSHNRRCRRTSIPHRTYAPNDVSDIAEMNTDRQIRRSWWSQSSMSSAVVETIVVMLDGSPCGFLAGMGVSLASGSKGVDGRAFRRAV